MYGVPPCEDLGLSVLLGFGDKLASPCIAPPLAAALCKGLVGHQEREPIPPTIERVKWGWKGTEAGDCRFDLV